MSVIKDRKFHMDDKIFYPMVPLRSLLTGEQDNSGFQPFEVINIRTDYVFAHNIYYEKSLDLCVHNSHQMLMPPFMAKDRATIMLHDRVFPALDLLDDLYVLDGMGKYFYPMKNNPNIICISLSHWYDYLPKVAKWSYNEHTINTYLGNTFWITEDAFLVDILGVI